MEVLLTIVISLLIVLALVLIIKFPVLGVTLAIIWALLCLLAIWNDLAERILERWSDRKKK